MYVISFVPDVEKNNMINNAIIMLYSKNFCGVESLSKSNLYFFDFIQSINCEIQSDKQDITQGKNPQRSVKK